MNLYSRIEISSLGNTSNLFTSNLFNLSTSNLSTSSLFTFFSQSFLPRQLVCIPSVTCHLTISFFSAIDSLQNYAQHYLFSLPIIFREQHCSRISLSHAVAQLFSLFTSSLFISSLFISSLFISSLFTSSLHGISFL